MRRHSLFAHTIWPKNRIGSIDGHTLNAYVKIVVCTNIKQIDLTLIKLNIYTIYSLSRTLPRICRHPFDAVPAKTYIYTHKNTHAIYILTLTKRESNPRDIYL